MKLIAAFGAALLLATPAGAVQSGLRGVVTRGPIQPVCVAGELCTAPAAHVTLTFARGRVVRSTQTDDRGRYRIALPAGRYLVAVRGARLRFSPRAVVVPPGLVAVRNFSIDTGIR